MTSLYSQVFGWTPVKGEGHVTLDNPDLLPTPALAYLTDPSESASPVAPLTLNNPEADPLLPSAVKDEWDDSISSDGNCEYAKRGDPSWVARPRNSFIIFRCNFSKIHARGGGKRVRRRPGVPPDKTLSKRAAEAWAQLSDAEKKYYDELAQLEKTEHSKRYPQYRFKPNKRRAKKHLVLSGSCKAPTDRRDCSPSPPQTVVGVDSDTASPVSFYPLPSVTPEIYPAPIAQPCLPPAELAAVKASRPRSSSLPGLSAGRHPQFLGGPKLNMKRSRSVLGRPSISRSPLTEGDSPSSEAPHCRASDMQKTVDGYYTTKPNIPYAPQLYLEPSNLLVSTNASDHPSATLTMSSSSLANWNGELSSYSHMQAFWDSPISTLSDSQPLQYPDLTDSTAGSQCTWSFGSWSPPTNLWPLSPSETSCSHLLTPTESPSTERFGAHPTSCASGMFLPHLTEDVFTITNFDYSFEDHAELYQPT